MKDPLIFISHSTEDKVMVRRLMDFIQTTFNLKRSNFFDTSDFQLETGGNWIEEIRNSMHQSNVIMPVVTPNYMESQFCLCELGAAWVNQAALLPIIIPPLNYRALEETPYRSWLQTLTISSKDNLLELGDQLNRKQVGKVDNMRQFDTRAKDFFNETLEPFIEEMKNKESITAAAFKVIKKELEEVEEAYQYAEVEMKKLKSENELLRNIKDAKEVQQMDFAKMDEWNTFMDSVNQVKEQLNVLSNLTISVLFHDFKETTGYNGFSAPNERAELKSLEDDGYIVLDDGFRPDYGHKAIRRAIEALQHLKSVIKQYGDIIEERFDHEYEDVRLSLSFKPFWEEVLGVSITSSAI